MTSRTQRLERVLGLALAIALGIGHAPTFAAAADDDATRLGDDLTPVGAERAGNAAGTIPDWTGGLMPDDAAIPSGYEDGQHLADPFADDAPRLVITGDNLAEHRDKLAAGHIWMLENYPAYRMPIYPTRRTAAFPQRIYEATQANATRATLTGTDNIGGAERGFAFPIPGNAAEVIWNHKTRYVANAVRRSNNAAVVNQNGSYTLSRLVEELLFRYANLEDAYDPAENMFALFRQITVAPPRLAGNATLVHESLNPAADPRKVWLYNPGQRRVRRAPNAGYDNPAATTDGLRTVDQTFMFNGALDRYTWTLVGKREMYIPYNAYRLNDAALDYDDILTPRMLNPEHTRYELHRVWVVESQLRDGTSHVYSRRTFYLDEDSWNIVLVDCYDKRDQLWRFQEGHPMQHYGFNSVVVLPEVTYDLQSGRYVATALSTEDVPFQSIELTDRDFSTSAIKRWNPVF